MIEVEWLSECCYTEPYGELDMTTVKYGGPSGFCIRCEDPCIFIKNPEDKEVVNDDRN